METAYAAGLRPTEFWAMTSHELTVYARSWGGAQMRLHTTAAWLAANWSRAKRMPDLSRVLDRIDKAQRGGPKRIEDWSAQDLEDADRRVMAAAAHFAAMGSVGSGEAGEAG